MKIVPKTRNFFVSHAVFRLVSRCVNTKEQNFTFGIKFERIQPLAFSRVKRENERKQRKKLKIRVNIYCIIKL